MNDTIYRQQAIDALDVGKELLSCALDNMDIVGNDREKFEWGLGLIESYIDDIKDIPPAQPERKKGRWILKEEYGSTEYMCSACHCREYLPNYNGEIEPWCYCPNCGADMRGKK